MTKSIDAVLRSQPNIETQYNMLQNSLQMIEYTHDTDANEKKFTTGVAFLRANGQTRLDTAITEERDTIIFDQFTHPHQLTQTKENIAEDNKTNKIIQLFVSILCGTFGYCVTAMRTSNKFWISAGFLSLGTLGYFVYSFAYNHTKRTVDLTQPSDDNSGLNPY